MRLQVVSSNSTYYWSVTNAVPAKPYLPIASGANTYYIPLTTATRAGIKLKVQSGNTTYRAAVYESGYYNTTSAAVGNLSSTTALTRASTSGTTYLTRLSTSGTNYGTRASTSGTTYLTRVSTSGTNYGTRASTSATLTRASTSATIYLTRASTSGTVYLTRVSTSNYTLLTFTKVTTNINGSIFATSNNNMYVNQYAYATYLQNAWAGYHVSGHVIVERDFAWNNGGYKTTAGNDFNKASYKFTNVGGYPTYQLESTNGRPKMWLWQANTTNTAATKSTISDIGQMPYGNTMWTYYGASMTGTSVSRAFSWTTFWFTNLATSANTTVQTGGITSASIVNFNNIFCTYDTRTSSIQIPNLFRNSNKEWKTLTVTRVHHYQYREARVRETLNTYSTRISTSGTSYLTRASTSGTSYATRTSASGYATRASTSGTTYLTRLSTSGTNYGTRASTSGTTYLTRVSTSGTNYGTRASTSAYSGKLSSSKWG